MQQVESDRFHQRVKHSGIRTLSFLSFSTYHPLTDIMSDMVQVSQLISRANYHLQPAIDIKEGRMPQPELSDDDLLLDYPHHPFVTPHFVHQVLTPDTVSHELLDWYLNVDQRQLFISVNPNNGKLRYFLRWIYDSFKGEEEKFEEIQLDSIPDTYEMLNSPYRVRGPDGGILFVQIATLSMIAMLDGYTKLGTLDQEEHRGGVLVLHRPERSNGVWPNQSSGDRGASVPSNEVLSHVGQLLECPSVDFQHFNAANWVHLLEEGMERFIAEKQNRIPARYWQTGMFESGRYRVNLFPWSIFSWQMVGLPDGYVESITIYHRTPLKSGKTSKHRHVVIIRIINDDGSHTSFGLMPDKFEMGEIVKSTHEAAILKMYGGLWEVKDDVWFGSGGPRLSVVIDHWDRLFRNLGPLDKQEKALKAAKLDRDALSLPCAYYMVTFPCMARFLDGAWIRSRGYEVLPKIQGKAWWLRRR